MLSLKTADNVQKSQPFGSCWYRLTYKATLELQAKQPKKGKTLGKYLIMKVLAISQLSQKYHNHDHYLLSAIVSLINVKQETRHFV